VSIGIVDDVSRANTSPYLTTGTGIVPDAQFSLNSARVLDPVISGPGDATAREGDVFSRFGLPGCLI